MARSGDDAISITTLPLLADFKSDAKPLAAFAVGDLTVEIIAGRESLWAMVRRERAGGLALRGAFVPGGDFTAKRVKREAGEAARIELESVLGTHVAAFAVHDTGVPVLRVTTTLTPSAPLLVPFLPRDLYPLDGSDDPTRASGRVEAAQRGLNAGLLYFHVEKPAFGHVLYLQNLTALNGYFEATGTKPDGAVGGEWPELGYLPPTPPQSATPPVEPLPANRAIVMSDAILVFREATELGERESARLFLDLLAAGYEHLDRPEPEFHDWPARARRTLRDLEKAPEASIRHYGHRYLHPYTATEYPDPMVQLSVIAALRDYEAWSGETIALTKALEAGLRRFFDRDLGMLGRYLPNVGDDKDTDAVDSWYLYHPLLNLGRLALDGDMPAKRLFLDALDYGIKAAHHFRYAWPIQYKARDFSVITAARNDDGLGQTDVGGLYAYVMLQAHALTGEQRHLDEARAAIDAARDMRFELAYQTNLTAWGAAACMRLWRITDERRYLEQSYVYLASFFHNCVLWTSRIGTAKHFDTFLGASALHDSPYMALFECYDSFAAFEHYLKDGGPDLDPAARMLISEYCRYALDRAWYYYPDALPPDAIAKEVRNGHIDRKLSFPVEDLYPDGQPAGQVGQEIYGCGAAFTFASRCFHPFEDAPFTVFCDHFLLAGERIAERKLRFQLGGGENREASFSVIRGKRRRLPEVGLRTAAGDTIRPIRRETDRIDYLVPANAQLTLAWDNRPSTGGRK